MGSRGRLYATGFEAVNSLRNPNLQWVILTGEFPPQPGGVSDYTRLIARALAATGDLVQVCAPPSSVQESTEDGVSVHRLPDLFGRGSRTELARIFKKLPKDTRVFVQYVPHAFGWKAMNLPFCVWLWTQRKRHCIIVTFHEVSYPWVSHGRILRHNFLALVNRLMAGFVARSARQIYVSIPAWSDLLRPLAGGLPVEWLPIPSTMPPDVSQQRVIALRKHLLGTGNGSPDQRIIGHFGTFGSHLANPLREIMTPLLAGEPGAVFLCVGRGGMEFAEALRLAQPALAARVLATGELTPAEVAEHLAACDLLVQPYPDGISSRRTSAMAGLALGRPILATRGPLTEPCWAESNAVRLVNEAAEMPVQASLLLADEGELVRLGTAGAKLYRERFDLSNTVARLRAGSVNLDSKAFG